MIHRPTLRSCLFLRGDLINQSYVNAMGQADQRGTSGAHIYCEIGSLSLDRSMLVVGRTPTCATGFRSRYKRNATPDVQPTDDAPGRPGREIRRGRLGVGHARVDVAQVSKTPRFF
jgi:hypothetical protein